ncbi:TetR/AcrR family transcriptional regulator [Domibacillus tundrae]|uniref:TetR/AcrR family transcriptional regulator n=1 Tax=Domibacillus tundrae TaxID=1587527 RepID=UPI000617B871|nr:TetR/AcrR family transcriptional regulator [Domibacillus tundrae]
MNNRRALLTREKILIKARELVAREGVTHLTIEKVAKEAEISKGGLLYHFSSKEALIQAMIDDMLKRSNQEIEEKLLSDDTADSSQWFQAFIHTTFDEFGRKDLISPGLLSILLANPELIETWRNTYDGWTENIEKESDNLIIATIVRLACEGLWFTDMLGFSPVEGASRQQVLETLLDLSKRENL